MLHLLWKKYQSKISVMLHIRQHIGWYLNIRLLMYLSSFVRNLQPSCKIKIKGFLSMCLWLICLQETMMDNALRTISYIADIGNIVVLMARRRMPRTASQDCIETTPGAPEAKKQYKMICHVFESEDVSVFSNSQTCCVC